MPDTISVFACATSLNDQVRYFMKSFEKCSGWDVRVVGKGMKWESFRTKMKCFREALRQVPKKQVVVCLDAYDALCIKDSDGFLDTFYAYHSPMVISYEINGCFTIYNQFIQIGCCPNIDQWKRFHHLSLSQPIHVNSGCIVGYAGEIYKMYDWILNYKDFSIHDDQIGVGMYMNEFPYLVRLDMDDKFVFNDNYGKRMSLTVKNRHHVETDLHHKPYFLHFPGMKFVPIPTNYETICSVLLEEEENISLHKFVSCTTSDIILIIVVSLLLLVMVVMFMIYRKK